MSVPFLLEIGVEELPAIPFLNELPNIKTKFKNSLNESNIECDFELYYTPRRIVLFSKNFPKKQQDTIEEIYGPPCDVAFKNGALTGAGSGFLKKIDQSIENVGRAEKNGKECLFFKKELQGKEIGEIINNLVESFIKSLNFGKNMRWGSLSDEFIRPIRWIVCLHDNKSLDISLFGITSGTKTFVHRNHSYDAQTIASSDDYFQILENGKVILEQNKRRELILNAIKDIEETHSVKVEIDSDLLEEIVAITEHPTPLLGKFDEEFLELPPEVIITSMKEHQRYFGVYKNGKLTNNFIVVSNSIANSFEKVIQGNEKVLRARLSDALFFYKNDLKNGLNSQKLESITFLKELGSMKNKRDREIKIALVLFEIYKERLVKECGKESQEVRNLIERAASLSKADLMSEMVYEFTELQGIMGYYYAKAANEDTLVSLAIKEQYLPTGESSALPSNLFGSIIALANKLDNLLALFSIGMIPSGTKDPFALRRAALGILRIVIDKNIEFKIDEILSSLSFEYKMFDLNTLSEFIKERIYAIFKETNPSLIKAVFSSGECDVITIKEKISALEEVLNSENKNELFSTFKRVANITKDVDINKELPINPEIFENEHEKNLFKEFAFIKESSYSDTKEEIKALFSLKPSLDSFFDNVMVNSENEQIKENRKHLIASIYKAFRKFADLKEITV